MVGRSVTDWVDLRQTRVSFFDQRGAEPAINLASKYLKLMLSRPLKRPYTVAISAYALTLLGKDPSYNPITPLLNAVSGALSLSFSSLKSLSLAL